MIQFTIYGNPVAQGRPRAFIPKSKKKVWTRPIVTDPQNAREWKQYIKSASIPWSPEKLIEGPIFVRLHFFLLKPKSLSKKVKSHIKRPDIENLAKAVIDALEGIFFRNDSQIISLVLHKDYCQQSDHPRVEIEVQDWGIKNGEGV